MATIRKNDSVIVISGDNKGIQGKVLEVQKKSGKVEKVRVSGVALRQRSKKTESGEREAEKTESFIHVSNVKRCAS